MYGNPWAAEVSAADPIAGLRGALRTTRPDADVDLLRRAYDVAARCHQNQFRRSGDPYVTHPLSVATILAGLGADDQTLCAAILHDTVEDTPYTLTAMSREFGPGIAAMVGGIMALDSSRRRFRHKLARAIAAAQSADTRVVEMKLADRLHNRQKVRGSGRDDERGFPGAADLVPAGLVAGGVPAGGAGRGGRDGGGVPGPR